MGYITEFYGGFQVTPPLDEDTVYILNMLNKTRRMKRDESLLDGDYGVDGEFYFDDDNDESIVDYNTPPSTQPGVRCNWMYDRPSNQIIWDGDYKFYNYIRWIRYIIKKILAPRGYHLTGIVDWVGGEDKDKGTIDIYENDVIVNQGEKKIKKMVKKIRPIDKMYYPIISKNGYYQLAPMPMPMPIFSQMAPPPIPPPPPPPPPPVEDEYYDEDEDDEMPPLLEDEDEDEDEEITETDTETDTDEEIFEDEEDEQEPLNNTVYEEELEPMPVQPSREELESQILNMVLLQSQLVY